MESISIRIYKRYIQKLQQKNRNENRLYFLLYEAIKDAIIDSSIPQNTNLPPSRLMVKTIGVSRSTVLKAYDLLTLEGYLDSRLGSGYYIKPLKVNNSPQNAINKSIEYPELSNLGKSFLENVGLINSTNDQSIAFRPGVPPLDIFPVNQWKNLSNLYWRHIKSSALTYSPSSGNEQLKKNIANYLNLSRDLKCNSQQIIIVSGSLQSLYLAGSVILNPNDRVIMENPTFPNVHSILKSLRSTIQGVSIDEEGIQVANFESLPTKLIHTTPSGHYPTGVRMSMKRRSELLAWASTNNSYIIENDFEHEVSNYKNSLPSLFSLDQEGRTIYMGTFNRLMHPSIRIGYMVLPFPLINPVEALLKHSHRFVPPSIQVVLNQFIEKKLLYGHVKNLIKTAQLRKQLFITLFEEHFGDSMTLINKDTPSLHLLAVFKEGKDNEAIIKEFAKKNIIVHAYSKCFLGNKKAQGFILGYSSVPENLIQRRLALMAEIYHQS